MSQANLITLKAAHDFTSRETCSKFTNLAAIQQLIAGPKKETNKQRWHFTGDWKKSVAPIYHSA